MSCPTSDWTHNSSTGGYNLEFWESCPAGDKPDANPIEELLYELLKLVGKLRELGKLQRLAGFQARIDALTLKAQQIKDETEETVNKEKAAAGGSIGAGCIEVIGGGLSLRQQAKCSRQKAQADESLARARHCDQQADDAVGPVDRGLWRAEAQEARREAREATVDADTAERWATIETACSRAGGSVASGSAGFEAADYENKAGEQRAAQVTSDKNVATAEHTQQVAEENRQKADELLRILIDTLQKLTEAMNAANKAAMTVS